MTRFHFERPDGIQGSPQNILVHLNEFVPPQGFGVVTSNSLLAMYPPIADNTFQFYKFYQIKKNQVPSLQSNLPVVIIDSLPPGVIQNPSGFDIRVFDSSGNPLDYEIEDITINPDTSANIVIWFNMDVVQDFEFVQLTFGNPTAVDGQTSYDVWSDYGVVYHMNQTIFGPNSIFDSTINNNVGSSIGSPTSVTGKIGKAYRSHNTGQFSIPNSTTTDIGVVDFSVEIWVETFGGNSQWEFITKHNMTNKGWKLINDFTNEDTGFQVGLNDGTHIPFQYFNVIGSRSMLKQNGLHHLVFTFKNITKEVKQYIDGVLMNTETYTFGTENFSNTNMVLVGIDVPDNTYDELRFSTVTRTDDYVSTIFNNSSDNNTFWFKSPLLEKGKSNFLVDEQGRKLMVCNNG